MIAQSSTSPSPDDFITGIGVCECTMDDGYCRTYRYQSVPLKGSTEEHLVGDMLDVFARVKTVYADAAKRIASAITGAEPQRPARRPSTQRVNPLIAAKQVNLPDRLCTGRPITPAVWRSFHDADGRITSPAALRTLIHRNGLQERAEPWLFSWGCVPQTPPPPTTLPSNGNGPSNTANSPSPQLQMSNASIASKRTWPGWMRPSIGPV